MTGESVENAGIRLGSMLFTMVEPERGYEREYNRWYERDHFYAGCLIGPYCFSGGRWVATRELKALRFPEASPIARSKDVGSFLSLYYILDGHRQEWRSWGADQVFRLNEQGRMYPHREHVHTLHYVYQWGVQRDDDGVPAELALDHRFPGLAVVIGERSAGTSPEQVEQWYRDELPKMLDGTPAAMCLAFRGEAGMPSTPSRVPVVTGVEERYLLLFFLDADPRVCWDDVFVPHAEAFGASGLGAVVYASPFIPTVPGTDTHLDELW
jgi:hypothetical protein